MSLESEIVSRVSDMGEDFALLLALLSVQYPATLYDTLGGDTRTVVIDLPTGPVQWEVPERDWHRFEHLELDPGRPGPYYPSQRRARVYGLTKQLLADRPRVPCPEIWAGPDGTISLTCGLDRHRMGNHRTPDGRSWWIGPREDQ